MNSLFQKITTTADNVVSLPPSLAVSSQKLIIRDLTLPMMIGILPEEKSKPQAVLINLQADLLSPKKGYNDDIQNTVSYQDIINDIKAITSDGHINLFETLAEKIIQACFNYSLIEAVSVRVEKPDIIDGAIVGIEMSKRR